MKQSKKSILRYFICMLILLILAVLTIRSKGDIEYDKTFNSAMNLFYLIFDGNRSLMYLVFGIVLLLPSIFVIDYYKYYHNNFISFIKTRMSYKEYFIKSAKQVFIKSSLFFLIFLILVALFINFAICPFNLQKEGIEDICFFIFNVQTTFIFYILFASIGFGVYNVLLLSLIPLIKNSYLYRIIGVLNLIIGIFLVPASQALVTIASIFTNNEAILDGAKELTCFLMPPAYFGPGLLLQTNGFVEYFSTIIIGLFISFLIVKYSIKKVVYEK